MRLYVSKWLLGLSLMLLLASGVAAQSSSLSAAPPPPCKCPCGGEIRCSTGQWGYCTCPASSCTGECFSDRKRALELAAEVLTVATGEIVTTADLRAERDRYERVLRDLLNSRISPGTYSVRLSDRVIQFVLTGEAEGLLAEAQRELRGGSLINRRGRRGRRRT